MSFDGTAYRKTVLTTLRDASPAQVEDLFWLAHVPREADDDAQIAEALKATRGFLFKERTRARQAAVAQAVLGEWPRIEATLLDAAARGALRRRLEQAGDAAPVAAERPKPAAGGDRRRRQVSAGLAELARLRDDPDLGSDLFAFLGLPTSATREMLGARIEKIAEVNRRRRPDRERALTDDLLSHARKLLLDGDAAAYLAGFDDEFRDRVVDALLTGDVDAARTALGAARARGVSDAAILARLETTRAAAGGAIAGGATAGGGGAAGGATAGGGAAAGTIPLSALGLGTLCPVCDTVASPGATTCATCRSDLQVRCESCTQLVGADLLRCSNCGALLDDPRAPLLARRATLRAETDALAAVEAAPPEQREAQLRALVRAHPEWAQAQRRLASLPPNPPRNVRLAISHNEALVTWEAVEGADAYLVERHGPQGPRVLGRTSMLEWTDSAPKDGGITWTVRALRGQNASSAPVRAASDAPEPEPEPDTPGVKDFAAIAGRPVVLSWRAPDGAKLTLTRRRDDVTRAISPDHDGYVDRKVQAGATYEYTVTIDGVEGSERSATVTVPSDAPVAAPGGAPGVSELVVRRRDDGRVEATWAWPEGTTEVFVAWDRTPPTSATGAPGGRKITNTRYQIDGGAALDGVPPGAHIAVFTGSRSAAGTLEWSVDAPPTARRLVP